MKIYNKIFVHLVCGILFLCMTGFASCSHSSLPDENEYPYSLGCCFELTALPSGNNYDNLAFVLKLPPQENSVTNLKVNTYKVYKNDAILWEQNDFNSKIDYNTWINDRGVQESNYQVLFYCMPQNYAESFAIGDEIKVIFECTANRIIKNSVEKFLIDNSAAVGLWKDLGTVRPEREYPKYQPETIPDEKITYNGVPYKLVFYDDFVKDFSKLNPLKNGMYEQAMDMNKWWTEDWWTYVNTNNGLEHRSIRDFKIHNGVAEFPMIKRQACETGDWANAGPSIMTSVWDPKGINSIPIYEFNKGIFEIKFMGPEGDNHPGQFTFWVLNYNTDFEARDSNGRYPTNPKKASDGYALDEIDFFEYSPSLNAIRTGARSCNSINHRPSAGYGKIYLPSDFGGKWHVFRCVWDETGLTSYLDGDQICYVPASSIKGFDNPNDKFMLLISSQSIRESGMCGDVYSNFAPYSYYVDYVKVYEKE